MHLAYCTTVLSREAGHQPSGLINSPSSAETAANNALLETKLAGLDLRYLNSFTRSGLGSTKPATPYYVTYIAGTNFRWESKIRGRKKNVYIICNNDRTVPNVVKPIIWRYKFASYGFSIRCCISIPLIL